MEIRPDEASLVTVFAQQQPGAFSQEDVEVLLDGVSDDARNVCMYLNYPEHELSDHLKEAADEIRSWTRPFLPDRHTV